MCVSSYSDQDFVSQFILRKSLFSRFFLNDCSCLPVLKGVIVEPVKKIPIVNDFYMVSEHNRSVKTMYSLFISESLFGTHNVYSKGIFWFWMYVASLFNLLGKDFDDRLNSWLLSSSKYFNNVPPFVFKKNIRSRAKSVSLFIDSNFFDGNAVFECMSGISNWISISFYFESPIFSIQPILKLIVLSVYFPILCRFLVFD